MAQAKRDNAAMLWVAAHKVLITLLLLLSPHPVSVSVCVQSAAAAEPSHGDNEPSHAGSGDCIASERSILLQFKEKLNDRRKALSSWNNEANPNCCKWEGVSCNNVTNHVVALSLGECGLTRNESVAPSEVLATISKLHMLQSLDLSWNFDYNSSISIPPEVGALRNLLFLNLSRIWLSSKVIPMHIGNLSSLKTLDLSYVQPGFAVLPTKALLSLSNLEALGLDLVSLQNNWPKSICKLHNIKTLTMNDMHLRQLPACFKNLSSLVYLSAKSAEISDFYSKYASPAFPPSLLYLDLSRNNLKGRLPKSLFSLASLQYLDLSQNNLKGLLPDSLCSLASLEYLDLSQNNLKGPLPKSLCSFASLEYLRLHDNGFNGTIPLCIGNLTKLNTIFLQNNEFEGSIPPSIYLFRRLTHLDLSSNFLSGSFSLSLLRNRAYLKRLALSSNTLTVSSQKSWSSFTQLEILSLKSCHMEGKFPSLAANVRSLLVLELSDNHFVGGIPSWVWKFEQLNVLDLSSNNFSGSIPSNIRSLRNLNILNLSKNKLYGLLPSYFPSGMNGIDLSHNLFNGSLPSFTNSNGFTDLSICVRDNNISGMVPWVDLMQLNPTKLDLSQNNLHGQLNPLNFFSGNCILWVLNLNSNHFSGSIPNLLSCSGLRILDIGNNKMHGSIPKWIGKLEELKVLILRSNNLEGQLPQELLMMNALQIFDISSNKLSGFLPAGFKGLISMASQGETYDTRMRICFPDGPCYGYNATSELKINNKGIYYVYSENVLALLRCIDVSNNQFTGEVPDEIGLLKGLIILNMSYNHFTGKIPKSLAQISQLDSLDLSNNFLSGEIPADLASLSMMGDLNLSCNNLTGKIPNQGHLTTFSASSFTGNPGLCGFQIGKVCPHKNSSTSVDLKTMHSKNDLHYLLFWLACGLSFGLGFAAVIIVMSFTAFGEKCIAIFDSIIYSMHFYVLFMLARIQALF